MTFVNYFPVLTPGFFSMRLVDLFIPNVSFASREHTNYEKIKNYKNIWKIDYQNHATRTKLANLFENFNKIFFLEKVVFKNKTIFQNESTIRDEIIVQTSIKYDDTGNILYFKDFLG